MSKDWADDLIQNSALELPMKLKFHLTSILLEGDKVPLPRKMLEWAIYKDHINTFRAVVNVPSMKVLINTLKVDIDFGIQNRLGLLKNFYAAAPGKEIRVARNVGDQAIHSVG